MQIPILVFKHKVAKRIYVKKNNAQGCIRDNNLAQVAFIRVMTIKLELSSSDNYDAKGVHQTW